MEAKGIPASRVFRAPDMLEDPQFAAGKVRWPGPALGAHTADVLAARAGCSAERLAELRAMGVI